MTDVSKLVDRYIDIWNETDGKRRRDLIARTWTDNATYLDPHQRGDGAAGIDAMIAEVQQRFPGWRFRHIGAIDGHNDRLRFAWEVGPDGQAAVIKGTDFATVASDHRLQSVTGFIDQMPQQ